HAPDRGLALGLPDRCRGVVCPARRRHRRRALRRHHHRGRPADRYQAGLHARPAVHAGNHRDPGPQVRRPGRGSGGAGSDRRGIHDPAGGLRDRTPGDAMSNTRKILLAVFGFYVLGIVLLVIIFGFGHKNNSFQIQNEFKLVNWVSLGVFSINRAVLYLFLAAILTVGTMLWISRRMQQRPNKVQTAVESLFSLMRDNITRGNMPDSMARRWFPFLGALFLFLWYSN